MMETPCTFLSERLPKSPTLPISPKPKALHQFKNRMTTVQLELNIERVDLVPYSYRSSDHWKMVLGGFRYLKLYIYTAPGRALDREEASGEGAT